ncbi:class I SAM-dependent methyltransferase [Herbivorax sp. ANBcel31]|uniref:class I SAM-dependent methyltransferase n=1 Tax=Herbivorax sp. ANBcel31 TaxID=3069754 RepID=UPI0027AFB110|nr:class I SAM-dependent methyltransferase [Herbivorax sp. ANBcel31]MDQ2088032.1 class I SAM-dependent methyltransferase [Herbivorax sp. ANBcel31]
MTNPFLEIPLDIYEKHMSLDSVYQLQTLNKIMCEQLKCYDILTPMILGVAGGNGLEHIDTNKIDIVYGVDINSKFLKTCRQRYSYLGRHFKEICLDLTELSVCLPKVDLIIANLFIEYIGCKAFVYHMQKICPKYISVVIQLNLGDEFVSDSPYINAFEKVEKVHHQIDKTELIESLDKINYSCILDKKYPLPNRKIFQRFDFRAK